MIITPTSSAGHQRGQRATARSQTAVHPVCDAISALVRSVPRSNAPRGAARRNARVWMQKNAGAFRLRSTTLCGLWHSDGNDVGPIARSFDQEAAAVRACARSSRSTARKINRAVCAGADGAHRGSPHRERGCRRHPALGRPFSDPAVRQIARSLSQSEARAEPHTPLDHAPSPFHQMCQIRRIREGEPIVVPPRARVQPVPAVHVPPPPLAIPPALQLVARRGCLLPHSAGARGHNSRFGDDSGAHARGLVCRRPL